MQSRRFLPAVFALFCLILLSFSSCDKCRKVSCVNGECVKGDCVCPSGFEGDDCGTNVNEKFLGAFTTDESCTAGSDDYTMIIEADPGSNNGLRIVGLWDQNRDTVIATVADNGFDFTIERQEYAGNEIAGEGNLGASLESGNIDYRVYATGEVNPFDTCTLSYQ